MNLIDLIFHSNFIEFAISTSIGFGFQQFVNSTVYDIIVPILESFLPINNIRNYKIFLKNSKTPVLLGNFLSEFINFFILIMIIMGIIYMIKPLIEKTIEKKNEHDKKIIDELKKLNYKY